MSTLHESTAIAEQAAGWIVRLDSDDAEERARAQAGFAAWKAQDPRHAQAAARMESFIEQVQAVRRQAPGDGQAAHAAMRAAWQLRRRQRAVRWGSALALAAVLAVPAGWMLRDHPASPWAQELADLRSTEGQWRHQVLDDGSQLTLSGAGAVRWRLDAQQRVVELLRGSVLVQVAHDASRPFYVQTPLGRVRALGTRFTVTYDAAGVRVEMLESRVAVQTPQQWQSGSPEAVEVSAGQRVTLSDAGVGRIEPLDPQGVEQGWRRHQLVVDDRPLSEVLDELARHYKGSLHFDRAALSQVRMTGVLPLDDPEQALQLLRQTFPQLQIRSVASR
ncbi:FecR domain-containing protein [Paracidovorax avenae]